MEGAGDIRFPLSTDELEGGHAMCMAGYQDDLEVPGGGMFLVRNSWGVGWARNSAVEPGYARIPYAFIQNYANSAYVASMRSGSGCALLRWLRRIWEWLFG